MTRWGPALGFVLTLIPVSAFAGLPSAVHVDGRLAPRDECASIPGFIIFRSEIVRSVRDRDITGLIRFVDPDVKLDFGGGSGNAELARRLRSRDGAGLWRALDQVLKLGCRRHRGVATMPWYFSKSFALDDPAAGQLIMGRDVPLYAGPSGAQELARIDWAMSELNGPWEPRRQRQKVAILGHGKLQGYVATKSLRSITDYRIMAERIKGRWVITAFVSGD